MKTNETQQSKSATIPDLRPGDFPIGSARSRAAARALVSARQPKLTTADLDCLEVKRMTEYLCSGAQPSYSEMQKLLVWQRGWALFKASEGFKEYCEALRELGAGRQFKPSALVRMNGWKPPNGN